MNYEEIKAFFAANVKYLDWEFYIGRKGEAIYLQLRFDAPDNYHPEKVEKQYCRKWQLSIWMTPTELVQSAWAAVQRAIQHEASEQFLYRGCDIYNTHMNVGKLVNLRKTEHALEHRPPPVKQNVTA